MKKPALTVLGIFLAFLFASSAVHAQSITVTTMKPQIDAGFVAMSCQTEISDPNQQYPGVESDCEFHAVSALGSDNVHTASAQGWPNAEGTFQYNPTDPGATYSTRGSHYLFFNVLNKGPNDDVGCPDVYIQDWQGYGFLAPASGVSSSTLTPGGPPVDALWWCLPLNSASLHGFLNWRLIASTQSDQATSMRITPHTPPNIQIAPGGHVQLSANKTANWSMNPPASATTGAVDGTGNYTAPTTVTQPISVTVIASDPSNNQDTDQVTIEIASNEFFIDPVSVALNQGQTAEFTATDANNQPVTVKWSADQGTFGATPPAPSSSATYNAPASIVPSTTTATVTATSLQDTSNQKSALVTLKMATVVVIPPNSGQIPANALSTINFGTVLQNFVDPAPPASLCAWTVTANVTPPGSLSNQTCNGATYTIAPGLTQQQALTVQLCYNGTKPPACGPGTIILVPAPVVTSVTPALIAGQSMPTVNISGTGFGANPTVVLTDTSTNTNVSYTAIASSSATSIALSGVNVPLGFQPEQIRVSVANFVPGVGQAVGSTVVTTTPATLTVAVAATTTSLDENQAVQLSPTVTCKTGGGLACTAPSGITWKIAPSIGSIDANNVYVATASGLTSQTTVTVTACSVANSLACSNPLGLQIKSVSVGISPNTPTNPPALTSGKTQQFAATVTNPPYNSSNQPNTNVTWSVSGSGFINASGLYSAPDTVTANETVTINACSQGDSSAILCAHAPLKLVVQPDFAVNIGAPTPQLNGLGLLPASSQVIFPITLTSVSGFSGTVSFSQLTGVPPGISGFFSPNPANVPAGGSVAVKLTLNSTSPPVGTWPIGFTAGAGQTLVHQEQVVVNVPQPTFTVSVTPKSQTVVAGASGQPVAVAVAPVYGFNLAVALSLTGSGGGALPAGVTATFAPGSIAGANGSSTMTIATTSATPAGTYLLNVTGAGGTQTVSTAFTLVVTIPDFTLALINNPPGTLPGHSTSTTVSVSPINGFTGDVTMSAGNLPPGATYSFAPQVIPHGSGSSTLTLNIPSSTQAGFYSSIAVTGTSGNLSHSDLVALEVGIVHGDNDPTVAFVLSLPNNNSITLYGGDTLNFDSLSPSVFPYPQTAIFKTIQTGGSPIRIAAVNYTFGEGLEVTKFPTPQSPADGSPRSSFGVLVHPTGTVAIDVTIQYTYASDSVPFQYRSIIHLKASAPAVTNDPTVLFHLQDEFGNRLAMGPVSADGTESPVTGAPFDLGTYGLNNSLFGVTRFLNVCNDSAGPISIVRFWDDTPDDPIFTDNVIGPTVLRGLVSGQCGQVAVFGSANPISGTFTGGPKIFATKSPEPPRLDSGNVQWVPMQLEKLNRTIPGLGIKANNDAGFLGYRGEVDTFKGPRNQPLGRTYTITNTTQVTLSLSSLKVTNVTGTAFTLLRNFSRASVLPGNTATFQVRFWPKTAGPFSGYVQFTTNSVNTSFRFLLQGSIGTAPHSAVTVTQGGVEVYNGGTFDVNGPMVFNITNSGDNVIQFSDLQVPANYQVNTGLPDSLAPGGSANIQLTVMTASDPSSPGAIMFNTDDADDPSFEMDENVGPILQDDYATTPENVPVTINVTANDIFQDSPVTLIASPITAPPTHGTAVRVSDSQVLYTPNPGFSGADSFMYEAATTAGDTSTAFVYVTVGGPAVNNLVAVDDQATADNGLAVDISVLANDSGAPGKILTISNPTVTQPIWGTVSMPAPGVLRYSPLFSTVVEDSFVYEITDGQTTARATVHVHLTQSIPPPTAVGDSVTTPPNTAIVISPLTNDIDPTGGGLGLPGDAIITAPLNGTAVIQGLAQILYTPNPGFTGVDFFQYKCTNGHGGYSSAWVGISVAVPPPPNYPPVAMPDFATTYINQAVIIPVTANDSDPDGDPVTLLGTGIAVPPHQGTAVMVDSGNIRYTPNPYVAGTDTFTYQIQDGHGHTATGQVTVTIMNHPPVANPDFAQTNSSTAININVVANDTDPEQDPISLSSTAPVLTLPPSGAIVTYVDSNTLNYRPKFGFVGTDTFTYQIQDLRGGTATGTVTVTVVNRPPVAIGDTANTPFNTPVTINVLQNDSDPDGHALSLSSTPVVSGPAAGATITVSGNALIYTPPLGFVGTDTFIYEMQDSYGAKARATVSVSIINRPPVAVADTFTVVGSNTTQLAVLANDSDPDGDPISLVNNFVNPLHGVLAIDSYKFVDYTATGCYVGADTFKYYVQDARGAMSQGTVTVNVVSDHLPVAVPDNVITTAGTFTTINVTANDCHPDNQRPYLDVNFPLYVAPAHGNIQLADNTTFYYTPFPGYHGTDSFQYNLRDAAGHYTVGTVNITIQ